MNGASQTPAIYYGVYVSSWLQDLTPVIDFETNAGKPVSIVMWYQGWGMTDSSQNFQPGWMEGVRKHGAIPLVTWEPWLYTQGVNQPAYSLQSIIDGAHDAYITQWAQASQSWGYPYFLRFAHEMNGNWNSWSERVNNNRPGQYVLAWRHIHDLFIAHGATNVSWVWSPNVLYSSSAPLKGLYPGDAYVDWVAMDGYNWGTVSGHQWQTFTQVFQQTYTALLAITSKPLMIAETASTEQAGNKAAWIIDGFTKQLPQTFPKVKAVVWFNENKETDWRIESSPSAQAAFADAISSNVYASNQFAALTTSPIPPL